jgi:FKBP-type peptidyl-prolyl cis-trans isomerase
MSPTRRRFAFLFLLAAAALAVPAHAQRERLPPEDREIVEQRWPGAQKTSTGIRFIVLQEGEKSGPTPKPGDRVAVLYKGMLLDGTVFDENKDRDDPFRPRVQRSELIAGWDQILQRMPKGAKWLVIIPHELAYGSRGNPPKIPRRATLVFEIELLDFGSHLPAD